MKPIVRCTSVAQGGPAGVVVDSVKRQELRMTELANYLEVLMTVR